MDIVKDTERWVKSIYFNADHLIRTKYWLKKLNPKADSASLIAAVSHDIERAFDEGRKPPSKEMGDWDDPVFNQWHSRRSAEFVEDFLKKKNADPELIKKVSRLISHHEEGGWKEADLLRDTDSISFLEINVQFFISRIPDNLSKKGVKEKFDYMFRRIGNKKAREIARSFYKKAIRDLELV